MGGEDGVVVGENDGSLLGLVVGNEVGLKLLLQSTLHFSSANKLNLTLYFSLNLL